VGEDFLYHHSELERDLPPVLVVQMANFHTGDNDYGWYSQPIVSQVVANTYNELKYKRKKKKKM
jgi:hypothetical protein